MKKVLLVLLFIFLSFSTVNAGEETYYPAVTNSKDWGPPGTRSCVGIHTVPDISVSRDFIRIYSSEILMDISITIRDVQGIPLYHSYGDYTLCGIQLCSNSQFVPRKLCDYLQPTVKTPI